MNAVKIVEALAQKADYSFEFDVTTGLIENDIISSGGTNLTQKCGLSVPCSFNEFISRAFGDKLKCRLLSNSKIKSISNEYISECYLSGELRTEINIYYPETNSYYRNLFFLYENDNNGHIMAYVVSRIITEVEDAVFTSGGDKKNDRQQEYELFYKKMLEGSKSKIPIIALSANALAEDKKMCLAAGMNGHIAKPIDISKLMDTLFGLFK